MEKTRNIQAKFTYKLLHPRYFGTWIGIGALYLLVQLPYPVFYQLGKGLGLLSQYVAKRRRYIAKRNLELCFPEKTKSEIENMVRENFISVGIAIFETGMAWFWSDKRLKKISTVQGFEHIEQAQKEKGILLIGIHFLTLELGARILGLYCTGTGIYRPNNNLVLDYIQLKGRLKTGKYMLDRYDTKGLIRSLKEGEVVWYAPDHDYGKKNSVFAPFFAVDKAATTVGTTLIIKLANPYLIPFAPIRTKKGHYIISVSKPLEPFLTKDPTEIATKMNRIVENEILKAPTQYMWLHRRFKTRPDGEESLY